MHQWHWSQGGVTLTCDGQWKANKLQDDDGQNSVSWAGRLPSVPPSSPHSPRPPLPGRLEKPTADDAAAAFSCRSAALNLSAACHFRINNSAPCSTRHNHLPAFCAEYITLSASDVPQYTPGLSRHF